MSIISKVITPPVVALLAMLLILALVVGVGKIARSEGIENPFARGAFEVQGPNNYSGAGGSGPPVLTNLRITNVPDFRVTNTGDNRAVAP